MDWDSYVQLYWALQCAAAVFLHCDRVSDVPRCGWAKILTVENCVHIVLV